MNDALAQMRRPAGPGARTNCAVYIAWAVVLVPQPGSVAVTAGHPAAEYPGRHLAELLERHYAASAWNVALPNAAASDCAPDVSTAGSAR